MRKPLITLICIASVLMLHSAGCKGERGEVTLTKDIVATAMETGNFNTLVTALKAADLAGVLEGEGPYTVFAPTDQAFAELPPGMLDTLLQPDNKERLARILKYHVVEGKLTADKVSKMGRIETLAMMPLDIAVEDDKVMVDGATITQPDIECSNGLIHVIDKVLMPAAEAEEAKDIVETAMAAKTFNTLVAALKAAELVDTLKGEGPFTVFAPTDVAFAKLPPGKLEMLLEPDNKEELAMILKYHVVEGKLEADKVAEMKSLQTLAMMPLEVTVEEDKIMVGGATLTTADIMCSNGVIHVVDTVIMPPEPEEEKASLAE
jgi:transforming growth factor-beta-induced protein